MIEEPYPELDEILVAIGEAGRRLSEIEASEGAAGNISVLVGWPIEVRRRFPLVTRIRLPLEVPELEGTTLVVSGSGRRLREIINDPYGNLGCLTICAGGREADLHTSPRHLFTHLTSELNSHLAVHQDQVRRGPLNFHAVIHAQPPHLVYLSHIPRYQDPRYLNTHILRWQPETIVNLPEGVGFIPFQVPSSPALMNATIESLRQHRIAIWAKHGVIARSDTSVKRAADRIEYAETGARYEYMNLRNNEMGEGLTAEEIRAICATFSVQQEWF
ncbi:MAG TPA: class II aldolase/adducin family protein [Anaerolineaceae bacterium]|nr:class II aldolase/adducin family protein [Anaerolineaceae bacterium]